jgi:DNA end-binding protein Ku
VSSQELDMAMSLVDQFAGDFEPEKFTDDYQEQLRTLIDAKLAQGDSVDTDETFGREPGESDGGEVLDLMEALRRSVDKSRGSGPSSSRSSSKKADADGDSDEKPAAAKKAPAKKKPAAKKASKAS